VLCWSQAQQSDPQTPAAAAPPEAVAPAGKVVQPGVPAEPRAASSPADDDDKKSEAARARARQQLKREEHQRILGFLPEFNTSNIADAEALSAKQKFQLAFKTAVDPATFAIAAVAGGFSQASNEYPSYGQGTLGFAKYFGASYADTFDGTILGNALFPALLHEDPRYFRKGTGSFGSRVLYAMLSTVRCKTDSGNWAPNFGNVMGNIAAGGIANLYYPDSQRGVGLTFERAFTVTAEGVFGSLLFEFWPDISHHFTKNKH
jgi:hypothetical protein